jgi:DNA-directed RNA polymerase specialized sigma24 family protein
LPNGRLGVATITTVNAGQADSRLCTGGDAGLIILGGPIHKGSCCCLGSTSIDPGRKAMSLEVPSSVGDAEVSSARLSAEQSEVIGRFFRLRRPKMVARAKRLMRCYSLGETHLHAEDAVHGALVKLCQTVADGKLAPIETHDDFVRAFRLLLRQHILDEGKRDNARKRGGSGEAIDGRSQVLRNACIDPDTIDSNSCPPDAQVVAEQQVEGSLALLDQHDTSLRAIVRMKMEQFTNQEIASDLGSGVWIVEKQLRRIRSILEPYLTRLRLRPTRFKWGGSGRA